MTSTAGPGNIRTLLAGSEAEDSAANSAVLPDDIDEITRDDGVNPVGAPYTILETPISRQLSD